MRECGGRGVGIPLVDQLLEEAAGGGSQYVGGNESQT